MEEPPPTRASEEFLLTASPKLSIDSTWYAAYALIRRSLSCKVVYPFWAARLTSGNNTRCPAESVLSRVWVASGVGLLDPGNVKFTRAGPDAFARQKREVTQKWRCKSTGLEKWSHCKKDVTGKTCSLSKSETIINIINNQGLYFWPRKSPVGHA